MKQLKKPTLKGLTLVAVLAAVPLHATAHESNLERDVTQLVQYAQECKSQIDAQPNLVDSYSGPIANEALTYILENQGNPRFFLGGLDNYFPFGATQVFENIAYSDCKMIPDEIFDLRDRYR